MEKKKTRQFKCIIINEEVQICLKSKQAGGLFGTFKPFIQCDQVDCQYIDQNSPPCPLHLEMFSDELNEKEEQRRQRKADMGEDDSF